MKKIFEALTKFSVGFLTAVIVSNKTNILLKLLISIGIYNRSLQNTIVSLLVTFLVTCIITILDRVYTNILFPMKISITSEQNEVKFKPNNNIYEPQRLNMYYEITPGGKLTMWLLKRLNVDLLIFFNPNYVDIVLEEDKKWNFSGNKQEGLEFTEQMNQLHYLVLSSYFSEGKTNKKYTVSVRMKICPKRIQNQEISLDYAMKSKKKMISSLLCKVQICDFKCKGVTDE
ncbi:hypothetical protein ACLUW2_09435 [Limosilactobacillus balticus]|uniref:hypothetical protein n=1 Tax=Limosilactobacillus balticus TaxID=2759747 RepID=UPI0039955EB8